MKKGIYYLKKSENNELFFRKDLKKAKKNLNEQVKKLNEDVYLLRENEFMIKSKERTLKYFGNAINNIKDDYSDFSTFFPQLTHLLLSN